MVITNLSGGLGNQMFQYAAGRRLASKTKTDLCVDISDLAADPKRKFSLGYFKTKIKLATPKELSRFLVPKNIIFRKIIKKLGLFRNFKKIVEKSYLSFDPAVINWEEGDVYLDGFWQSEKYFADITEEIRVDFSLLHESDAAKKAFKLAEDLNSVSVHYRRGDYISDKNTNSFHGSFGPEYYNKAIALATKNLENPKFFIFSDDPEWVRNNFGKAKDYINVGDFGLTDAEEIILMSKCKNNVIANSSFSWWGAWLNKNKDKVVIAPKKWFANEEVVIEDRFPADWTII